MIFVSFYCECSRLSLHVSCFHHFLFHLSYSFVSFLFSHHTFFVLFFFHLDECVSVVGMGLGFLLSSLTSHKWYLCSFDSLCFNFATRM